MNLVYDVSLIVVIIEFFLILLVLFIVCVVKIYFSYKIIATQKLTMRVENYLAGMIPSPQSFKESSFKEWRIDIILPILYKFARLIENISWAEKRIYIISNILLPLARKATYSKNWLLRFYAAESFSLMFDKSDEKFIIQLVSDEIRLVCLSAINAAIKFGSEKSFDILIKRMAKETKLNQTVYLPPFDNAPTSTMSYIVKILSKSSNENIRIVCYRILLKYSSVKISWDFSEDIHSKNLALKIITIRLIECALKEDAVPLITDLLNDKNWEVKAVVLQSLGNLNATIVIPYIIPFLESEEPWLKLIASQILLKFKNKGVKILELKNIIVDPVLINFTQYVLNNL